MKPNRILIVHKMFYVKNNNKLYLLTVPGAQDLTSYSVDKQNKTKQSFYSSMFLSSC